MPNRKDSVHRVYALAARLGVGMGEACDRAGIARSTPPRWKHGTTPRPNQLANLRQAILLIANERGMVDGLDGAGGIDGPINRAAIVATLAAARDIVHRLEQVLGIGVHQA